MSPKRFSAALGVLMALLFPSQPARAATVVWNGSSNNQWTNSLNWDGNVAPTNIDLAVFPPLAVTGAVTNATNATLTGLLLTGSGYTLQSASVFSITNGVTNAATTGSNEIAARIQFRAPGGTVESAGHLVLSGGIIPLTSATNFLHTLPGGRILVSGNFSNSGTIRLSGNETEIAGNWTGSGSTKQFFVQSGRLYYNGSASNNVSLKIEPGAILGGTGMVGSVSSSGRLRPGIDGVGTFTIGGAPGSFSSLGGESLVEFDLLGSSPGQFDQLKVNPGHRFGMAGYLKLNFGFLPALGVEHVIVSGGTNSGNFRNARPGHWSRNAIYQDGPYLYDIAYMTDYVSVSRIRHTSTGNTLSWNNPSPSSTNWSSAANWNPAAAPKSGDALFFGPAVPPVSSNDLGPLTIASIAVSGRHSVGGESLALLGNVTVTNNAAGAMFQIGTWLQIASDLTFRAGAGSLLEMTSLSGLSMPSNTTLTVTGAGTNRLMGYMFYTGGNIVKTGEGTLEITSGEFDVLALGGGDIRFRRPDGNHPQYSMSQSLVVSNSARLHFLSHDPYQDIPGSATRNPILSAPLVRLEGAVLGSIVVTPTVSEGKVVPLITAYTNLTGQFSSHPEGAAIYDAVSGDRFRVHYTEDGLSVVLIREAEPIRFTSLARQPDQSFRLQGVGEPNYGIVVEWSTNLTNWTQLGLRPVSDGTFSINDPTPDPTNRFYRARRQNN